ncbi:DNA topoisomerase III [Selenomonas sp. oral taxon 138]|uniref:DNA topoisomerase III n=1 Tax=Selenomonas sp. oral taxon 138 TaxID=712532 RepID=UPI0002A2A220|nr:DNA topoisomerase III [Selenomonas sp. oral taxon 138]EKY01367.1 DNA topoisomerase [Selenomonas sp. oral taxon 138 str. F0429]
MRLYIAEKPSVGRALAACLPAPHKKGAGWIETGGGVVTWLFGHVLRQAEPEEYDPKLKRWRAEDLPILPTEWRLVVNESAAQQFAVVKGLIERADEIVHGGDPDREGQLLVDEVLDYLGNEKPVRRILINALNDKSIHDALGDLRDNRDFLPLKRSALARARADWLIGMNLSRAYTLAVRRAGHDRLVLPIGRVKTPTLALVVRREREIENFKPATYYLLDAVFRHEKTGESFRARWKPSEERTTLDPEGRLVDESAARAALEAFGGDPQDAKITRYERKKKEEPPPLPFSLSALQVLAGKRYGYEPQQVLDTAQKLYEEKLTSYPRSDAEYLPVNQHKDAPKILGNLAALADTPFGAWAREADAKQKSRAWNDAKISAHHAIIPTTVPVNLARLSAVERNIYELIARAYIAQFHPNYVYDQTKVEVTYHGDLFSASGRTERAAGWRAMYRTGKSESEDTEKEDEESTVLPPMKKGDAADYVSAELGTRQTKPPTRFTPATLLQGMKEIHKYVMDEAAKKMLRDVSGIGTEATRASIIEDLIRRKFLHAAGKKKVLTPTESAYLLIDALPDTMTYPDATAVWEDRLHSMAEGEGTPEEFLAGQAAFARDLCNAALSAKIAGGGGIPCPACGRGVMQKRKGKHGDFWGCSAFPRCRMTANDANGKPDFAGRRIPRASGAAGASGGAHVAAMTARRSYTPTADEQAEMDAIFFGE